MSSFLVMLGLLQMAFNWYINIFLDNESSSYYEKLVAVIESMDEIEWKDYDFQSADKEASKQMRETGVLHYSKFVNRSLAVKWPSPHLDSE